MKALEVLLLLNGLQANLEIAATFCGTTQCTKHVRHICIVQLSESKLAVAKVQSTQSSRQLFLSSKCNYIGNFSCNFSCHFRCCQFRLIQFERVEVLNSGLLRAAVQIRAHKVHKSKEN